MLSVPRPKIYINLSYPMQVSDQLKINSACTVALYIPLHVSLFIVFCVFYSVSIFSAIYLVWLLLYKHLLLLLTEYLAAETESWPN